MNILKSLYTWVIVGFIAGCGVGLYAPSIGIKMASLGSQFIKLIRVFVGPLVFLTVVVGIARSRSLPNLGRIGLKSLIYFEGISTIALLIGWAMGLLVQPGSTLHIQMSDLDAHQLALYDRTFGTFLQEVIPDSFISPFLSGNILQILLLGILFGTALLLTSNQYTQNVYFLLEGLLEAIFRIIRITMYISPLGVFGAMAFTLAKFGGSMLLHFLLLIATFYFASILFVSIFLGIVAMLAGFSLWRFLRYLLPEIFLVLATSSGEVVLPQLLEKLQKLGCKMETIGLIVPLGYSFNLDGTSIYITLSALFIAQALGIQMSVFEQCLLFLTAMLSSKGAAGVPGTGFIMLATTLAMIPSIPVAGMVLILGVDRFMSEARSLVNFIGNAVGALVVSLWEGDVTHTQLRDNLTRHSLR